MGRWRVAIWLAAFLMLLPAAACGEAMAASNGPGTSGGAATTDSGTESYEYPGWNGAGNQSVWGPDGGFESGYWSSWDTWYDEWYGDDDDEGPDWDYEPGWRHSPDGWWFQYPDGSWPANGWLYIRGRWYRFNESGHLVLGWLTEADGSRYYLNPVDDGTLGSMRTGWQLIDGKAFYFNPKADGGQGRLLVNTTTPDGYQVGPDGAWQP